MEGLGAAAVRDDKVAAVLGVDVGALQRYRPSACVRHLSLGAVVEEQPVGEHEPSLLVPLDVVRPLVEPSLR